MTQLDTAPTPVRRRRRALVTVLTVLAVLVVGVAAVRWLGKAPSAAPYDDPAASARIALCDTAGHSVTEGSITEPLAAVARTATTVPSGAGQTATLFAFQPRDGIAPQDWSGLALTASALVAGESTLAVEPGADAITLAQFLAGYPAQWDGWVQLRLIGGSTADGVRTGSYSALDLTIDGDRWRAVDPGSCAS